MSAGVHHGRADVVDQLLFDELLAVPDRIEHLADRERRHRVLADQAEVRLVLGRRRVFHPEQVEGLECLAQSRGLDRRQPVVHVVQQVRLRAESRAQRFEELRNVREVSLGRPDVLARQVRVRGFVEHLVSGHPIGRREARNARLRANREISQFDVARDLVHGLVDVAAVRMTVNQDARAAPAPEQLIQRQVGRLCLEVPKRSVDRGDGRHRHRPAPPVRTAVEKLPDILDLVRVTPEQAWDYVLTQVRGYSELAAVQGRIADAVLSRRRSRS